MTAVFTEHDAAVDRELVTESPEDDPTLTTDASLLHRVLVNMVLNAFEATEEGGRVRLWCESDSETVTWQVWNDAHIPDAVAMRIFQRFFSTKAEVGRGLGTYGMKILGERCLGGRVTFTTSEQERTTFSLTMPRNLHQ